MHLRLTESFYDLHKCQSHGDTNPSTRPKLAMTTRAITFAKNKTVTSFKTSKQRRRQKKQCTVSQNVQCLYYGKNINFGDLQSNFSSKFPLEVIDKAIRNSLKVINPS